MPSPPAPWVSPEDIEARVAAAGVTGVDLLRACQAATDFLYERSGRRFNVETWTVRPQRVADRCGCWWPSGEWRDAIGSSSVACRCSPIELTLNPVPVNRIVSVTQDGVVLPAGDYALFDSRRLVRLNGRTWPCCQWLSRPTTEAGTFEITFVAGDSVPELGAQAARELAYQHALAEGQSAACSLPARAVQVDRQGISVTLADATYLTNGLFGISLIDEFLLAFGAKGRATFMGPDQVRLRTPT